MKYSKGIDSHSGLIAFTSVADVSGLWSSKIPYFQKNISISLGHKLSYWLTLVNRRNLQDLFSYVRAKILNYD